MVTTVSEFTSAAVSDRGLNESRPENEDSFIELPQYGLFAVADGVGGAQAGEVASQMAVEILGEAFVNMGENADPEDTMRIALERANEAIFQMSNDIPQLASMATTIAAVHISGDMATIAHVGDSRVYRVDGNGRLFRETDDHSVVEEEVRAGRMTPEQALNHPSRNVISRALGAEDNVSPDIKCVLVHPGTTFLLCSDGITRHISDPEIEQLLNSEFGPDDICGRMKEICFSRGAEDNLTAVILRFPAEPGLAAELTPVAPEDDEDIEEVTVAGLREPMLADADTDENIEVPADAIPSDDGAGVVSEASAESEESVQTAKPEDEPVSFVEQPDTVVAEETVTQTAPVEADADESTADPIPARSSAGYGYQPGFAAGPGPEPRRLPPVLFVLIGLAIGAAIGAAAVYFTLRDSLQSAQTAVISEQKSNNVSLTAFEDTRRLVDRDPAWYVNAKAITPKEAGDHFWLGRALLLTDRPVEAKRQFEQARSLLPQVQETMNVKTMAYEIGMALAIVDSLEATELFKKEVASINANNRSDANSNTSNNAAPPVR